jgi:hypothetical protein
MSGAELLTEQAENRQKLRDCPNREFAEAHSDICGVRIEDNVLATKKARKFQRKRFEGSMNLDAYHAERLDKLTGQPNGERLPHPDRHGVRMIIAHGLDAKLSSPGTLKSDDGRDQRKACPAQRDFAGEPEHANVGVKPNPIDGTRDQMPIRQSNG